MINFKHRNSFKLNWFLTSMNILFLITSILLFSIAFPNLVFASSYDINIPTGAASPDAPYFWQNEKSGLATGDIDILIDDTVVWKNADTVAHTVTSGTPSDGPDWIRSNAHWWIEEQITDDDFATGIEFMIKEKIISIPNLVPSDSSEAQIPDWVKNNAGWRADGLISDQEFANGIKFLVISDIIQV